jgi:hypothetical protein
MGDAFEAPSPTRIATAARHQDLSDAAESHLSTNRTWSCPSRILAGGGVLELETRSADKHSVLDGRKSHRKFLF